jgi:hypothetical protein
MPETSQAKTDSGEKNAHSESDTYEIMLNVLVLARLPEKFFETAEARGITFSNSIEKARNNGKFDVGARNTLPPSRLPDSVRRKPVAVWRFAATPKR